MSKIQQNRIIKYQHLKAKNKSTRVYSSVDNSYGFILEETTPYQGEAGFSSRVRVIWEDGKTTTCSMRGMKSYHKKHYKIKA